jgi:pyruvate kinase
MIPTYQPHYLKKTKIIATLGPVSSTEKIIEAMAKIGVNVFRLNFSHGTHDTHKENIRIIRETEKKLGTPLGILADLQGPKFRIGLFETAPISLKAGQKFSLDLLDKKGTNERVSFLHKNVYSYLKKGSALLLDDGKIQLKVTKVTAKEIETVVQTEGLLSDHKGVNIPHDLIPSSALTEKDHVDLRFILKQEVEFIALSFVQNPEDILDLRKIVKNKAQIIAKIEKPQAIKCLEEIITLSDGIMVARGDLGVELSPENVPALQKKIVRLCRMHGKPVIVATQMLESMINSPTPTRAEASDVATAVYDGADGVMLSAESAAGHYPLDAVQMMVKIINNVEQDPWYSKILQTTSPVIENTVSDAITSASQKLVCDLRAELIVTFTATGGTAFREAHKRPPCPIVGLTHSLPVARKLTLTWGVIPILLTKDVKDFEQLTTNAVQIVKKYKLASKGARIIVTFGVPFGRPGTTNIINVEEAQ